MVTSHNKDTDFCYTNKRKKTKKEEKLKKIMFLSKEITTKILIHICFACLNRSVLPNENICHNQMSSNLVFFFFFYRCELLVMWYNLKQYIQNPWQPVEV